MVTRCLSIYTTTNPNLAANYPKGWTSFFHNIVGYDEPLSEDVLTAYQLKEITDLGELPEHHKKVFETLSAIEYSTVEQALKTFKTNYVEGI
ncbi:hypothetical protein P9166_13320 (plasmid) [Lactococcus lactis]|nr:hypothetical protein P9166_13320 [Lactococcus lactis]